ncbi:hypothetical protein [Aeromonas phage 4L372XY]|uniref:Uncharacterized protein n=1 Tax=Aeromonas phage 4L372XY TaxID=2588520 RepID=A0A5B9NA12_9CAUD|nr:hypothetical protein HWC28_gp165 [Aeromonas phage 4L372XY]QEG08880.1 hypothetical protein [Aeromonas phage 4L372XY]
MKDKEMLYRALQFWINHIETGDIHTDKETLLKCCPCDYDIQRVVSKLPKLDESQLFFISILKGLQFKILNDKIGEVH